MPSFSPRNSRLFDFAGSRRRPSDAADQSFAHAPSPSFPDTPSFHSSQPSPDLDSLAPPHLPFAPGAAPSLRERTHSSASSVGNKSVDSSRRGSFVSLRGLAGGGEKEPKERPKSLSVNYVPAKFTKLHAPGEWTHRRAKQGGGRDAFAGDAARMGAVGTVDDDEGVVFEVTKGGLKRKNRPKLRWNRFKWALFVANSVLLAYSMTALIAAILVWLNVFYASDVIRVGNREELIVSTVAAGLTVFTALLGFSGILLNNRAFLAVYTLLLWACLAFVVAPGYMTYKQRTFNLEGKINSQWSRTLGSAGRLRIQDALRCCGYYNPFIEAALSPLCYPRSILPGCKNKYLKLEREVLETWYTCSFAIVPVHIGIILAALLCSNHITYRFGKGLTPKRYRLDLGSMAVIMDEYVNQIAAQYGPEVAAEAKARSSLDHQSGSSPFLSPSASSSGTTTSTSFPALTKVQSRLGASHGPGTGAGTHELSTYNSTFGTAAADAPRGGSPLFDPRRDSFDSRRNSMVGSLHSLPRRESRFDEAASSITAGGSSGGGGGGGAGRVSPEYLASGSTSQHDHDHDHDGHDRDRDQEEEYERAAAAEMADRHGEYNGPAQRWGSAAAAADGGAQRQSQQAGTGPSSRHSIGWAQ